MSWLREHGLVITPSILLVAVACAPLPPQAASTSPVQSFPAQAPAVTPQSDTAENSEQALAQIAADIELLKGRYPQLEDFSAVRDFDRQRLVISFGYRTHRSRHPGGWTSGVPNPDDEGVWFYIDFHDPTSTAQIHTQPVAQERRYREKRVMLLVLDGKRTEPLTPALHQILHDQGVVTLSGR